MKIRKFISNKAFSSNVYVCSKNNINFIIDPGYFDQEINNYLKQNGGASFVLLTHGHFDHTMGIDSLIKYYPNTKVYAYYDEIDLISNSKLNGSQSFLNIKYNPSFEINPLYEGKNMIEGISFHIFHNPGHTNGSVSYYFDEDKVIFTGDFIFAHSIGRCDLPRGSEAKMYNSIIAFKNLKIDNEVMLYPGHDQVISIEKLFKVNPYLK